METRDLETWCRENGWTYAQMAAAIGASGHARVSEWARGIAMPRDGEIISRIAEVTGGAVTLDALHARWRAARARRIGAKSFRCAAASIVGGEARRSSD